MPELRKTGDDRPANVRNLPHGATPRRCVIGGRDVYFDPDYCLIVDPAPSAVRRAVETLRDRAIPRDEIRARTLERVRPQRQELMAYLSALKQRMGSSDPPFSQWPFSGTAGLTQWAPVREHARDIAALAPIPGRT